MDHAKLDSGLKMLLAMTAEEAARWDRERGLGIEAAAEAGAGETTAKVTVVLTPGAAPPAIDGVTWGLRAGDSVTARVTLAALGPLTDRPEVVYVAAARAARPLLDRTRGLLGGRAADRGSIRSGAQPWDGRGVTVGVIDIGFDLRHPSVRQFPGGPTRVAFFWDRAVTARPTDTVGPSATGVLYNRAQIDQFLLGAATVPPVMHPETVELGSIGHGCHTTGTAAGRGDLYRGFAPGADLILVSIGDGDMDDLPQICDWIFSRATGPCSINISLGSNDGPHDGTGESERGLDQQLADAITLAPRAGRFISVAAGNERLKRWHLRARVLPAGQPATAVLWVSNPANDAADELHFWYPGLNQVRIRLVSPLGAGNAITRWVAPSGTLCVDQADPGGGDFAPAAPGVAAAVKQFTFADGTDALILQEENLFNGDRHISVRIRPGAAAAIQTGLWHLELDGVAGAVPEEGCPVDGYVNDAVGDDTRFYPPPLTTRALIVPAGGEIKQEVFVPDAVVNAPTVELVYPERLDLTVQVRPPLRATGALPSQIVGTGPAIVAPPGGPPLAGLTAPTGAGPFTAVAPPVFHFASAALPAGQDVTVNHRVVAGRKRISVQIQGAPPEAGLYGLVLRNPGTEAVAVEARLLQRNFGADALAVFQDDAHPVLSVPVLPAAALPTTTRLLSAARELRVRLIVTVPGGGRARLRVWMPPEDSLEPDNGVFTPFVAAGQVEDVTGTPLRHTGTGPLRRYERGDDRVTIDYPAPGAGAPGVATIELSAFGTFALALRLGEWRVEYQGVGTNAPIQVTTTLVRMTEAGSGFTVTNVGAPIGETQALQLVRQQPLALDLATVSLRQREAGPAYVTFLTYQQSILPTRLQLTFAAATTLAVRLFAPDGTGLPFSVGQGNAVTPIGAGAAPAVTPTGVLAALAGGTEILIDYPAAELHAGTRAVTLTVRSPVGLGIFHPLGIWRVELDARSIDGQGTVTARLSADGAAAAFVVSERPTATQEQGSLSVPGSGREILSVANGDPNMAPLSCPDVTSSPGSVRQASRMRIGSDNRPWLTYAKPDLMAPGVQIAAPCAGLLDLAAGVHTTADWQPVVVGDWRALGMRASWPTLTGADPRVERQFTVAGDTDTWGFRLPDNMTPLGAAGQGEARFVVHYRPGHAVELRVRQVRAGAANPTQTHFVNGAGAQVPGATGAAATLAASTAAPGHPDGPGRLSRLGDESVVIIRQNGAAGRASVVIRNGTAPERTWELVARNSGPSGVGITVEAEPRPEPRGWPKLAFINPLRFSPTRELLAQPLAVDATNEVVVVFPSGVVRDVTMRLTYPAAAGGNFRIWAAKVPTPGRPPDPADDQITQGINRTGGSAAFPWTGGGVVFLAPAANIPNGRRFRFANGNDVRIDHTATGSGTVVFARGTASEIAAGHWMVGFATIVAPPAPPLMVSVDLDLGPHDAPHFLLPQGHLSGVAFTRHAQMPPGAVEDWPFRMPEGRHTPLVIDLVYDMHDNCEVQLQDPAAARTEAVGFNNAIRPGALVGASLANTAAPPAAATFEVLDLYVARIDHVIHPATGGRRRRVRITIAPNGPRPIPAGDWHIRIHTVTVHAGGAGVIEGWIDELLHQRTSGTSMAAPHMAGLAALMLQQDHTQSHHEIKRRMMSSLQPVAIGDGNGLQLPGQWDPAAGWGAIDGEAALLGHHGGLLHAQNGTPAAVGKTTGCPVACADNCLIEGERGTGGALVALRTSRRAPQNRSPAAPGADPLPPCPRLDGYLQRFHAATPFAGGASAARATLATTTLSRPLVRGADRRGDLAGFETKTWDEAYRALADRLVSIWSDEAEIVIVQGRPEGGLLREVLFNRFVHHLHRLMTAANKIKKCSFTTKATISQVSPRVAFGSLFSGAALHGIDELLTAGSNAASHARADLSLTRNVVVWGANLTATAPGLWRSVAAARAARGEEPGVLVVDPAPAPDLPAFARRLAIVPGGDRTLALALLLRLVGDGAAIPADPRFADADRGRRALLGPQADNLDGFITHVRAAAAGSLRAAGGRVLLAAPATGLFLPGVDPATATGAARAAADRVQGLFDALYEAYLGGPTATVLGTGPGRHVDGEEHVQYVAALAFLTGNVGTPGGGVSFGDDRHAEFNTTTFAGAHETRRPADDTTVMGSVDTQEQINVASLGADAPSNLKAVIWFDADPLTTLPDAERTEQFLRGTRLNVQVSSVLDDSSALADIVLPMADTLGSWDLQLTGRSPWINLTQPLLPRDDQGRRPPARVLHELYAAIRAKLASDYHDDLKPEIDEPLIKRGPLLLSRARMAELAAYFDQRVPVLLADRLPSDEITNIRTQLRAWYDAARAGQPTADTDTAVTFANAPAFFDRVQIDWILELLLARYPEREVPLLLYGLVQRGTVVDPAQFRGNRFGVSPEGGAPRGTFARLGTRHVDLRGAPGFAPERAPYRDAVRAVETGPHGRAAFPMRLVIAQHPLYDAGHIPLDQQLAAGNPLPVRARLNPQSPSIAALNLATGESIDIVGNLRQAVDASGAVTDAAYESALRAVVDADPTMAHETVALPPGWHGLGRGGQRVARAVHSEEGEVVALFDNLVRVVRAGAAPFTPSRGASGRGPKPPKRGGST